MNKLYLVVLSFVAGIFLVACRNSEATIQTAIAETKSVEMTIDAGISLSMTANAPTNTVTPSPFPTYTSTSTPTGTPLPTNTLVPLSTHEALPELSSLAITLDEMTDFDDYFGELWLISVDEGIDCLIGLDNCFVVGFNGEKGKPLVLQINVYDDYAESSTISEVAKHHVSDSGAEIVLASEDSLREDEWLVQLTSSGTLVYGFPYDRFIILSVLTDNPLMSNEDEVKLVMIVGNLQALKLRELGY